ncbi:MAG: hypothetical protein QM754_05325 [Tepidisphaeraceae bacterium]
MIAAGEQLSVQESLGFEVDALEVLGGLRTALTAVLTSFSGVRKPADLQKLFKLDWTLSWQVFQIAGPVQNDAAILGIGSKVPSRASLKRFLDAAEAKGVDAAKVERVWLAFDRFENLVEVHAGDRSSFISMVSAASGFDAEWLATDAQHRRNTFRATSHLVGMQAMAKHICGIIDEAPDGRSWNIAVVVGYVGLRMLRAMPSALVFRMRMTKPQVRPLIKRVPLGTDPDKANGYLLADFSTASMPSLVTRELDAGWLVTEIENPRVGNQGACSLRFGTGYLGHPVPGVGDAANDASFASDVVVDKPVEVIVSDLLVKPGIMRGATPTAEVWLVRKPAIARHSPAI